MFLGLIGIYNPSSLPPGVRAEKVRVDEELEAYPTESVDLRCQFVDGGGRTKLTQVSVVRCGSSDDTTNVLSCHMEAALPGGRSENTVATKPTPYYLMLKRRRVCKSKKETTGNKNLFLFGCCLFNYCTSSCCSLFSALTSHVLTNTLVSSSG